MWEPEKINGRIKQSKDGYQHMDWSNNKEITIWEIAYYFVKYYYTKYNLDEKQLDLDELIVKLSKEKVDKDEIEKLKARINKLPIERRHAVQEQIYKFINEKNNKLKEERKRENIDSILLWDVPDADICRLLDMNPTNDDEKKYIFDPELFANVESAKQALVLVEDLTADIINSIMENGVRYRDRKYNKDIKSAKKAIKSLKKSFEKLGISKTKTLTALRSMDIESPTTVKQELISQRENITEHFIALGNSKTNSRKIAEQITLLVEQNIPITSKF